MKIVNEIQKQRSSNIVMIFMPNNGSEDIRHVTVSSSSSDPTSGDSQDVNEFVPMVMYKVQQNDNSYLDDLTNYGHSFIGGTPMKAIRHNKMSPTADKDDDSSFEEDVRKFLKCNINDVSQLTCTESQINFNDDNSKTLGNSQIMIQQSNFNKNLEYELATFEAPEVIQTYASVSQLPKLGDSSVEYVYEKSEGKIQIYQPPPLQQLIKQRSVNSRSRAIISSSNNVKSSPKYLRLKSADNLDHQNWGIT